MTMTMAMNKSKNVIKTNYEFEKDMSNDMSNDIKSISTFLEYIIKNSFENLTIKREIISKSLEDTEYPSDFYSAGKEYGTWVYDLNSNECEDVVEGSGKTKDEREVSWVEWSIIDCNNDYYNTIRIKITPFVTKMETRCKSNGDTKSIEHEVSVFNSIIFEEWESKFVEIMQKKKKKKVGDIISNSYKILGLDRKIKIQKILGDDE